MWLTNGAKQGGAGMWSCLDSYGNTQPSSKYHKSALAVLLSMPEFVVFISRHSPPSSKKYWFWHRLVRASVAGKARYAIFYVKYHMPPCCWACHKFLFLSVFQTVPFVGIPWPCGAVGDIVLCDTYKNIWYVQEKPIHKCIWRRKNLLV